MKKPRPISLEETLCDVVELIADKRITAMKLIDIGDGSFNPAEVAAITLCPSEVYCDAFRVTIILKSGEKIFGPDLARPTANASMVTIRSIIEKSS